MKSKSLITTVLIAALALTLVGCTGDSALSIYLESNRAKLAQPASMEVRPQEFVVAPGTPAKAIAQDLQAAGLIDDPLLFEAYVRGNGLASKLEAGAFTLSPSMTIPEIVEALQHAQAPSVAVSVRPGWRLEQTADYLRQTGVVDGDAYRALAGSSDLRGLGFDLSQYTFLQFHPAGASLEGYLYPDTYQVPREGATAADLIKRQLDEFEAKVMPVYWEAVAKKETKMELHDVLTIASIVEREAVVDAERPTIAGVYLNRLAAGMRLEADPTVQYAMGFQPASGQWWKTPVYLEEYGQVDSPYNTYRVAGLPPGPIAAPSLKSIQAVLNPDQHDYLFFVAMPDKSGRHVFSRTFDEHLQNVRKYRGG